MHWQLERAAILTLLDMQNAIQVRGRKHVSAVSSAPDACNDPRLSWLGIRWHLTNKKVAVQTVIAGKAAAKTAKIMVGDDLLKVDEEQAAATVTGVNKQQARALTTKPMVLD